MILRKTTPASGRAMSRWSAPRIALSQLGVLALLSILQIPSAESQIIMKDQVALSRSATVRVIATKSGAVGTGTGFFVADDLVLTCMHVVAKVQPNPLMGYDLTDTIEIETETGEKISASMVSPAAPNDPWPKLADFAFVRLGKVPATTIKPLQFAIEKEAPEIGQDVVFSGYPLSAITVFSRWGKVAGLKNGNIYVQAPINQGDSGAALLNTDGKVIGIVAKRHGDLPSELKQFQDQMRKSHAEFGSAIHWTIETLDKFMSTGLGHVTDIKFAREYRDRHSEIQK